MSRAIAARPPTIRLAGVRRALRARRLRSGGYVLGALLAVDLGSLCRALVAAGVPDASLQVREGRDCVAFVLSFHATAAVTSGAAARPLDPASSRRRRA